MKLALLSSTLQCFMFDYKVYFSKLESQYNNCLLYHSFILSPWCIGVCVWMYGAPSKYSGDWYREMRREIISRRIRRKRRKRRTRRIRKVFLTRGNLSGFHHGLAVQSVVPQNYNTHMVIMGYNFFFLSI